jgi:hypothetical protein
MSDAKVGTARVLRCNNPPCEHHGADFMALENRAGKGFSDHMNHRAGSN